MTTLDESLFRLMNKHPEWKSLLSPDEITLLVGRSEGRSLESLAEEFHLTTAGIRNRLYGKGAGRTRRGGILGHLRGLSISKGRHRLSENA